MGDSGGPLSTSTNADGKMQVIGVASNVVGLPNANGLMEFCVGYGKQHARADFLSRARLGSQFREADLKLFLDLPEQANTPSSRTRWTSSIQK